MSRPVPSFDEGDDGLIGDREFSVLNGDGLALRGRGVLRKMWVLSHG